MKVSILRVLVLSTYGRSPRRSRLTRFRDHATALPAQFENYIAVGKKVARGEPVKGQRIMNAAK